MIYSSIYNFIPMTFNIKGTVESNNITSTVTANEVTRDLRDSNTNEIYDRIILDNLLFDKI